MTILIPAYLALPLALLGLITTAIVITKLVIKLIRKCI